MILNGPWCKEDVAIVANTLRAQASGKDSLPCLCQGSPGIWDLFQVMRVEVRRSVDAADTCEPLSVESNDRLDDISYTGRQIEGASTQPMSKNGASLGMPTPGIPVNLRSSIVSVLAYATDLDRDEASANPTYQRKSAFRNV